MKVKDLMARLEKLDPEQEIMILDGFNGGGVPRTINLDPSPRTITEKDGDEAYDCEDKVGEEVAVMGYGCY